MILHLLAQGSTDVTQLPIWVAGPLAGLVFILFITQLIVPGRTFTKLSDDYDKSREMNERVIPLAERMVNSQNDLATSLDRVTHVMEDVLDELARHSGTDPPPRRRRQ